MITVKYKYKGEVYTKICFDEEELKSFMFAEASRIDIISMKKQDNLDEEGDYFFNTKER